MSALGDQRTLARTTRKVRYALMNGHKAGARSITGLFGVSSKPRLGTGQDPPFGIAVCGSPQRPEVQWTPPLGRGPCISGPSFPTGGGKNGGLQPQLGGQNPGSHRIRPQAWGARLETRIAPVGEILCPLGMDVS